MAFDPRTLDQAGRFLGFSNPSTSGSNPFGRSDASSDYVDADLGRFAKSNLRYLSDDAMSFQDPTYLGFKLLFKFDQPESGLLSRVPHTNTALGYLQRIGDTERAGFLLEFIDLLAGINSQCPWFWQTIEGLDDAWKRHWTEDDFAPKYKEGGKTISIGCLESIDLRVTAMMDLYRKACFDWNHMRQIVPWNLRQFSVSIYITETRRFHTAALTPEQRAANRRLLGPDASEQMQVNRMLFELDMCEFMPDESSQVMSSVSNSQIAMASQKLAFKYQRLTERNAYVLFSDNHVADDYMTEVLSAEVRAALDRATLDDPSVVGPVPPLEEAQLDFIQRARAAAPDAIAGAGSDVEAQAEARARRFAQSAIGGLILGNLYGFSPVALTADSSVLGVAQQTARATQGAGPSVNESDPLVPSSYFDDVTPNPSQPASGNTMAQTFGPESDGDPGTSLVNYEDLESSPGNLATGPSLENTVEEASGNLAFGNSLDNTVEDAGGSVSGGASLLNQPGVPSGGVDDGPPIVQEGPPQGNVNGQAAPVPPPVSLGSVGGGESLSNSPDPAVGNSFDGPQPSRSNVDGSASGSVGGGPSTQQPAGLPLGTISGAQPPQYGGPDRPSGSVEEGESPRNGVDVDPKGNVYRS